MMHNQTFARSVEATKRILRGLSSSDFARDYGQKTADHIAEYKADICLDIFCSMLEGASAEDNEANELFHELIGTADWEEFGEEQC